MSFPQRPRHCQAKPGALPAALRLVASVVAAAGSRFGPGVQATLTRTKGGPGAGQMVPKQNIPIEKNCSQRSSSSPVNETFLEKQSHESSGCSLGDQGWGPKNTSLWEFHVKSLAFRSCRGCQEFHDIPYQWWAAERLYLKETSTPVGTEYKSETNNPLQISVSLPWTWLETPHTHKYWNCFFNSCNRKNAHLFSTTATLIFHQRHTKHCPDETSCCFLAETWNQIQPGPRPCTKYPGSQGWNQRWPMGEYRLWSICLEENSTV